MVVMMMEMTDTKDQSMPILVNGSDITILLVSPWTTFRLTGVQSTRTSLRTLRLPTEISSKPSSELSSSHNLLLCFLRSLTSDIFWQNACMCLIMTTYTRQGAIAFRFFLQGSVNVCLDSCLGVQCSNGQRGFGRRRREVSEAADPNKVASSSFSYLQYFKNGHMISVSRLWNFTGVRDRMSTLIS